MFPYRGTETDSLIERSEYIFLNNREISRDSSGALLSQLSGCHMDKLPYLLFVCMRARLAKRKRIKKKYIYLVAQYEREQRVKK